MDLHLLYPQATEDHISMENMNQAFSDAKKAILIQELMNGREFANQLLQLVRHYGSKSNNNNIQDQSSFLALHPFAEDLATKILRSFTNTLFLFNTTVYDSHHIPITDSSSTFKPSPESDDHLQEYFHETCKTLSATTNRRGCYKRKRNIETWEKDSPILVEDGHEWRKYGQKETRDTKYLRNYYRCSHKYDDGCPATKQVQRIQEKPPLYRTTYYGLHTCNNNITANLDPSLSENSSSILISFNNTNNYTLPTQQDHSFLSSSSSSTKKEHVDDQEHQTDDHGGDDIILEQNLVSQYEHVTVLSSNLDLFSSVKVESFEVDDVLLRCFDFDEFVRFGL